MILQLLSILLLVGVAEAGDSDFVIPKPYVTPDVSAKITYCSNGTCGTLCEQRMKEAMLEIDEIVRLNHGLLMDRDPGQPRMCLNLSQNAYRQWERVMKECAK